MYYLKKVHSDKVSVLFGHVVGEINKSVGVYPLVIVPGNNLDELWRHLDTSLGIEDGGKWAGDEILGNNILIGVAENALKGSLGSILHLLADLLVGGTVLKLDGQINN